MTRQMADSEVGTEVNSTGWLDPRGLKLSALCVDLILYLQFLWLEKKDLRILKAKILCNSCSSDLLKLGLSPWVNQIQKKQNKTEKQTNKQRKKPIKTSGFTCVRSEPQESGLAVSPSLSVSHSVSFRSCQNLSLVQLTNDWLFPKRLL